MRPAPSVGLALTLAPPAALVALLLLAPGFPLRLPLALAALLWSPGHALLAIVHPLGSPRLAPLERLALSLAVGLALAPLLALLVSVAWGFDPLRLAWALLLEVALLAGAAALRARVPAKGPVAPRAHLPSTPVTFAIAGAALLLTGALFAFPLLSRDEAPAALVLMPPEGNVTAEKPLALEARLVAGAEARRGVLVVDLARNGTVPERLAETPVEVAAGKTVRVPIEVPGLPPGRHQVTVRWLVGKEVRGAHLWLVAEAPHA